jgi:hypothetical protein
LRPRSHHCGVSWEIYYDDSHPKALNSAPRRKITKLSRAIVMKSSNVNCMDEFNVMQNTKSTATGHHAR